MKPASAEKKISDHARERGIAEVVHFSTNLGFTGCLHSGYVLPRSRLKAEDKLERILTLNAPFRSEEEDWFDKTQNWINYVNLSVSEITTNLFRASLKWHQGKDVYWVIMAFGIKLLDDPGVFFTTTNNIYPLTERSAGLAGFEAMFAPVVRRRGAWQAKRGARAAHLTTCEQAEVLYPDGLAISYLSRVYVRIGDEADRVHAILGQFGRDDVEVVVDDRKFLGKP
ncbi:MAG: DarT ssDNA thymidine ADP-ribosyltransferase family protein [Candidatus Acidiferrales bacterium]